MIQNKLSVLSQAGLAKDDFSSAESAVLTAKVSKDFTIIIGPLLKLLCGLSYVAIPCVTVQIILTVESL